jgi:hypothetical protein
MPLVVCSVFCAFSLALPSKMAVIAAESSKIAAIAPHQRSHPGMREPL